MTPPSLAGEYEYHTLASVAGAPQNRFIETSSSSVVACVVSSSWLNPRPTAVAPVKRSFPGAAARAGGTTSPRSATATIAARNTRGDFLLLPEHPERTASVAACARAPLGRSHEQGHDRLLTCSCDWDPVPTWPFVPQIRRQTVPWALSLLEIGDASKTSAPVSRLIARSLSENMVGHNRASRPPPRGVVASLLRPRDELRARASPRSSVLWHRYPRRSVWWMRSTTSCWPATGRPGPGFAESSGRRA